MEKQFPMVVIFEVKKDKIELIKTELIKLIAPTKAEDGCVQYDLHQDLDHPGTFIFYEIWENKSKWIAHDLMQHVADFKIATKGLIQKVTVHKLMLV